MKTHVDKITNCTTAILFSLPMVLILFSCNKLVNIPEPSSSITTTKTFNSASDANSAISAIYNDMTYSSGSASYASGSTTIDLGKYADELIPFGNGHDRFQNNNLLPSSTYTPYWQPPYFDIYMANAAIEGLNASTKIPGDIKGQLIGEAKFLRAYIYFYLVNLYGDVPLVTSTSYAKNSLISRTPSAQVYQLIIADLIDAQQRLPKDYLISGGERTRANYWVATALLARVYLYQSRWAEAAQQASVLISNSSMFNLTDLNNVFLKNSNEAIFQLENINNNNSYAINEAYYFIPPDTLTSPNFTLTSQLLSSFEKGDLRRAAWVDSTHFSGDFLYYPYKYKVLHTTSDNITEYEMVLRLGEQFLIRAEANAQQNKLGDAINDLNVIRSRAGLPNLSSSLTQTQVLSDVEQERRIELFAEWGHRWFDLKRTGQADAVLQPIKPLWKPTAKLFPIPQQELLADPNLTQNPGY